MFQRIVRLLCCVAFSGCAAGGVRTIAPQTTNGLSDRGALGLSPDYETKNGVVFVSSEHDDIIVLYPLVGTNLSSIGSIVIGVSAPLGMSVDAAGTLYVANYSNSSVSEYPKGKVHPSIVLTAGIQQPGDAVVAGDGSVFVSNNTAGTVVAFHKGANRPFETIGGMVAPLSMAFDDAGNLFVVDERVDTTGCIWEVQRGKSVAKKLNFKVEYPAGIAVDGHENVYVTQQNEPPAIDVYRAGSSKPIRSITAGLDLPYLLSVSHGSLFAADFGAQTAMEYDAASGKLEKTYSEDLRQPFGIAVLPADGT